MGDPITLLAVGDTGPYGGPVGHIFEAAKSRLAEYTWRFAQVERTFSDRGSFNRASLGDHSRRPPEQIAAYQVGGFDVVSVASNHALDWGVDAFTDTLDGFENLGIKTVGGGRDKDEAHAPAILEQEGVKVAMLAYCSVLHPQYWAEEDRAGCAPLRADTYFQAVDYIPGSPALVRTFPYPEDSTRMVADIEAARRRADFVLVSCHWGVHYEPRTIADYQIEFAHSAIDAGADGIIGHGPHSIRGVEGYGRRPILYSLGNFVLGKSKRRVTKTPPDGRFVAADVYNIPIAPGLTYDLRQHSKWGLAAEWRFRPGRRLSVRLHPTVVNEHGQAVFVERDDPVYDDVVEFLRWASEPVSGSDLVGLDADGMYVRLSHDA